MRWLAKAAIQGTISLLPRGRDLNYYLQRNVSRRLPRSAPDFEWHAQTAVTHLTALRRARPGVDPASLRFYEFGAGWDLIGPLAMWALGVDTQTIVDIRPNVKLELVNDTILRFAREAPRLEEVLGSPLRPVAGAAIAHTEDLRARFGITYLAPQDARSLPFPDASVDFVSSTFTLEHIPAAEIAAILTETRRILTVDGVMSSLIDMNDHYHYTDPTVSVHNFLRYPEWAWRLLNPGLSWQSRLRHPQYLELFAQTGYAVIDETPNLPTDDELAALRGMRVAPEFRRFSLLELGTKATHLVVSPAG